MLVALQHTGDDRVLPPAAEHLVRLLRSWGPGPDHLAGLALTGISVPSRLGPRFVDALVFTPCGVIVIVAHEPGVGQRPGPGERAEAGVAAAKGALAGHDGGRYVTGLVAVVPGVGSAEAGSEPGSEPGSDRRELSPGSRGREAESSSAWGEPAPGLRDTEADLSSHRRELSPGSRGTEAESGPLGSESPPGSRESEADLGPHGGELPPDSRGSEAELRPRRSDPPPDSRGSGLDPASRRREPSPDLPGSEPGLPRHEPEAGPGVAVVLADPRGLRRIIGQHNRWRIVWSADDVLDACYALSLAHLAPSRAALLADGFPARLPSALRLPRLPAVVALPAEPTPSVAAEDEPRVSLPRGPVSAVFPRPRPIRQVPWGLVVVLILLVAAGVVAAVFVAQVFHGS